MSEENIRAAAIQALLRWEESEEFAHEILHDAVRRASWGGMDRAFFTELFYGVLRHLTELDFLIGCLREGPVDARTRQVLRIGLYQIFHMRVAEHAAVHETVEKAGRARSLVNALLRRSLREKDALLRKLAAAPAHVRTSHPELLIERWRGRFGEEAAVALCAWNNEPAPVFVRANELKVTLGELQRSAPAAEVADPRERMLKVRQLPFAWLVDGLCYVQDPSTLMACDLLAPQLGERVLDACAAPGGKTTYLAQLMMNQGSLVACDASTARLERLRENTARLGVSIVEIRQRNWLDGEAARPSEKLFDRILVDAPCSNTGVIRRRIDVRWRLGAQDFPKMQSVQIGMLEAVIPLLKPGGVLVYSTCSLEREENEQVADEIGRRHPELRLVESRQSLPFRDGMDGAYAARFEKIVPAADCDAADSPAR